MPPNKPPNKPTNPTTTTITTTPINKNIGRHHPKLSTPLPPPPSLSLLFRLLLLTLIGFTILLFLMPVLPLMFAQNTQETAEVEVVSAELFLEPLLDNYGYPAINADGTLYPNDQFTLTCHIKLPNSLIFEKAAINYPSEAFNMLNTDDLTSPTGLGAFEVSSEAEAKTYLFNVEIWGREASEPENTSASSSYVITQTTLSVQVVHYDPHFTPLLTYTLPNTNNNSNSSSSGESSFDCPFAQIIRYDGNGPTHNLAQRAIIDDYHWDGYAQKIPQLNTLHQQQLIPNLTVANFFNQTTTIQFLTIGITNNNTPSSSTLLIVDGETLNAGELPQTYSWQINTNHTYTWTKTLQATTVTTTAIDQTPNNPTKPPAQEWFEWQLNLVFPPSSDQIMPLQTNQISDDEINPLIQQFNSPNGTLTTTPIGSTVTAIYAHNKPLENFAQEQNISKNQTLHCTTPLPLYFNSNQRYAKIQYRLDPQITKALTTQNFTDTLHYNVTTGSTRFGNPNYFTTNFTTQYHFYNKPFNVTAYHWNPTNQTWNPDPTVNITASFKSAFNFTQTDILLWELEEQTTDQTALKLVQTDMYDSDTQTFSGTGTLTANLKQTSPLYYNLHIEAKQKQTVTLQRTIQLNFRNNQSYNLPLNLDPTSPLPISIIADDPQTIQLTLEAPTELGGLTTISIYQITKTPPQQKNLEQLPKDQLNLKLQKTLNLTQPQQQIQTPPNYDKQTAQFYQYYEGYSSIFSEALGFCGQTQLALSKDPTLTALTDQGEALLYVEATNVWNTTFHQIIAVQPYSDPKWNIPLNQATIYLTIIIIVAILTSFTIYLIRAKQ